MDFPCIIRSVQVSVIEYLHAVHANLTDDNAGIDLPEFCSMVTMLRC
jgi:hypothetical protein